MVLSGVSEHGVDVPTFAPQSDVYLGIMYLGVITGKVFYTLFLYILTCNKYILKAGIIQVYISEP